jgi:hypothetical protein
MKRIVAISALIMLGLVLSGGLVGQRSTTAHQEDGTATAEPLLIATPEIVFEGSVESEDPRIMVSSVVTTIVRIEMAPNEATVPHPHIGTGMLQISAGTVCVAVVKDQGAIIVVSRQAEPLTETTGCGEINKTCEGGCTYEPCESQCVLAEGRSVQLWPGDSIYQSKETFHAYANVTPLEIAGGDGSGARALFAAGPGNAVLINSVKVLPRACIGNCY